MSEILWSVDSLVVRDNTVFGFGWAFHKKQEITELFFRLTITGEAGLLPVHLSVDIGKPREDVEHAFSTQPNAFNSGYVFFGAFPFGKKLRSIDLLCSLEDGSVVELAVPDASVIRFSNDNEAGHNHLDVRQFYLFVRRGVHLIRAGKFKSLFSKIRRYLKGRPKNTLHEPSDLAVILRKDERKDLSLIVDHDLGGGANNYRDRLVDSIIQEGRTVIILTYHVATLSHMLILRNRRINIRFSIPDKKFFLEAVRRLSLIEIIYNTGVSVVRPEEIPPLLISLRQITSARLKILVHDFFTVCPSHFLIDSEGKYCHIPDMDVCSGCLSRNQQGFSSLFVDRDMPKWRAIWGSLLAASDEIVTFSNSSAKILQMAYPQIDTVKISIVPHKVHHLTGKLPQISNTGSLCIGIVGQIGFHKGSVFVQALAREIKRREIDLKIVIIGSIEASCDSSIVSQTGGYDYAELPAFIEGSGANVMLFPSIWPETFSYVVQELMDMKLPIASFNLGAPAERLSSYPKGLVLDSMDPGRVLNDLISFHREVYLAY
jgi:glycosyltransferase involved in cell wall biosynthesis